MSKARCSIRLSYAANSLRVADNELGLFALKPLFLFIDGRCLLDQFFLRVWEGRRDQPPETILVGIAAIIAPPAFNTRDEP
jgi:hypothetical protein